MQNFLLSIIMFIVVSLPLKATECPITIDPSMLTDLQWPMPGMVPMYDLGLLPFKDAWCNHRLVDSGSFPTPDQKLDVSLAYQKDVAGEVFCWNELCHDHQVSAYHVAIDISHIEDERNISRAISGSIVGKVVYPVASGQVRTVVGSESGPWQGAVVVEHALNSDHSCKYTSVYWHLGSVRVNVGDPITKRSVLGTVADLKNNHDMIQDIDHLHLGIRLGPYDGAETTALAGRLYENADCDSKDRQAIDESGFIDPALLVYEYYPFGDVRSGDQIWFCRPMMQLVEAGVLGGFRDGLLRPTSNVTRAQFLKMTLVSAGHGVSQMHPTHWYDPYLEYAEQMGFIDETSTFKPNEDIARHEAITLLAAIFDFSRYVGPVQQFSDVSSSAPYYVDLMDVVRANVVKGYPDGTFHPNGKLLRAEAAKMICKSAYPGDKECEGACI